MRPCGDFKFAIASSTVPDLLGFSEDRSIRDRVARALDQNRVLTAYQPIASADGARVAFHECLARLHWADGRPLPAAAFVPAIENTNLICRLDRAMLRNACAVIAADPVRRLSVNLSPSTIGDAQWLAILEHAVARNAACGDLLIVEIVESTLLSLDAAALEFLHRLRQLGCSIAIDDFGGGHSSLKHLARFRFDFLKIDGAFVRDVASNKDHQFLIESMVNIAQHFEMVTVAEMVENRDDRALLADLGIDCVQGMGIGAPEIYPDWLMSIRSGSS